LLKIPGSSSRVIDPLLIYLTAKGMSVGRIK
jgi:hypothetical protein